VTDMQSNAVAAKRALTGSQRVALSRRRRRKEIVFLGIEILPTERDALIRMGLLNKVARNHKKAVREALYAFLEGHLDPENTTAAFAGERIPGRVLIDPAQCRLCPRKLLHSGHYARSAMGHFQTHALQQSRGSFEIAGQAFSSSCLAW
jgi:hypothetical protein